jgi:hypothetical protein
MWNTKLCDRTQRYLEMVDLYESDPGGGSENLAEDHRFYLRDVR